MLLWILNLDVSSPASSKFGMNCLCKDSLIGTISGPLQFKASLIPSHTLIWLFRDFRATGTYISMIMAKTLGFRSWLPFRSQLQGLVSESTASRIRRAAFSTLQGQQLIAEAEIPSLEKKLREFERTVPIEEASTPPSSWYTDPAFAEFEMDRVFSRGWQAVGHIGQVERPGDFFTGRVGKSRYVVCKNEEGQVQAFHNVCRHHAAAVASGAGCTHSFVCPYHGWTYGLDGKLRKATRLAGIRKFAARENGLLPICTAVWGPFVLISLAENQVSSTAEEGWLGSAGPILAAAGVDTSLRHVATREYVLNCNWKVYCDNYLDGGYHVPHAHQALAACLDLSSYSTTLMEKVSIQSCGVAKESHGSVANLRVGRRANYTFVYPNFMINRYGPWIDTNLVLPISPSQCRVVFDWFLEPSLMHDKDFIESSVKDSEVVQVEDITICEDVQDGLMSPAYNVGRYAPSVEQAMHHFHCLLYDGLSS